MTFQPPFCPFFSTRKIRKHRHVPWTSLAPGVALSRPPSSQLGLPQDPSAADVAEAHQAQGGGGGDAAADRGLARLPGTAGAAGGK